MTADNATASKKLPSATDVVATLVGLGTESPATDLCSALIKKGYSELESQLAIQRAADSGRIQVNKDWTLSVPDLC